VTFRALHQGLILAGFAGIALSVLGALLYVLQSRQLKSHQPGRLLFALPSLDRLDRLHFRALSFGLILFSTGLLSGLFRLKGLADLARFAKDPTVVLSLLSCGLYWAVLVVRASSLRRGHKIAVGTLVVFVFLVVTLLTTYVCPVGHTA